MTMPPFPDEDTRDFTAAEVWLVCEEYAARNPSNPVPLLESTPVSVIAAPTVEECDGECRLTELGVPGITYAVVNAETMGDVRDLIVMAMEAQGRLVEG